MAPSDRNRTTREAQHPTEAECWAQFWDVIAQGVAEANSRGIPYRNDGHEVVPVTPPGLVTSIPPADLNPVNDAA